MPLKYTINPWDQSIEGTICATLRAIWREADAIKDKKKNRAIKELAATAYDKANRMDRSLRKYRKRFMLLPQEIQDELSNVTED